MHHTTNPQDACRTTQHCAYHGWCRRCDPAFAETMSQINVAIQRTDADESHWGPLYEAVGKALCAAAVPSAAETADRATVYAEVAEFVRSLAPVHPKNAAWVQDCHHIADRIEERACPTPESHNWGCGCLTDGSRVAAEEQPAETQDSFQVWPLRRVLAEVRCGSQDWTWDEEWADLDRRHAETGYLAKLEQAIRENGITMPVLIGSDGRLWDGHHRLRIAARLGIDYVPVEITPQPARPAVGEQPDTQTREALRCVCGDPVQLMDEADPSSWIHSPGSDTSCLDARPRCPHCQMPHNLTPGSLPVAACASIRARIAAEDAAP